MNHSFPNIYHSSLSRIVLSGVFALCTCLLLFTPEAHAATTTILPNGQTGDTTGDTLADVTADDATCDPDTLSAVGASDTCYTVDKGAVMTLSSFNASAIPAGSTITGATLKLQYGAENGYAPTTAVVRYNNGAGLTTTGINPTDIAGWSTEQTFDLYAAGSDTVSELEALDIEFTSSDTGGADAVHFDYVYITVTYDPPVLSQTKYIFLNDNGTTTDTYTQSHSAATSTSISSVKKGEKLIARIQIDNTGLATSSAQYRLQWENNTDAAGTWTDLGTTTQIRWALSEKAAMPGRSGQVPLTSRQVNTCTTTTQFVSGFFVAGTATSSMLSLGPTKCTELAYAIETSGATLNKTYRLRLVTGDTATVLDAYTEYPTFTIESAQTLRYSKEGRGGYATTTLDSLGSVGQHTSVAIGADGFPVIAYYDNDAARLNLNFAKCNDLPCSSYATSSLDWGGDVGQYASIAIGSDKFPVISYYDASKLNLNFAKCNDLSCSSYATSSLDTGGDVGVDSSIAIGSDGFPVISYYDGTNFDLKFAKCNNPSCSSYSTVSVDTGGDVGRNTSIAIGSDGFPAISYEDVTNTNPNFAKCNNLSCTSVATTSPDTTNGYGFFKSSIAIGSDGFPVISYYDNGFGLFRFIKCSNNSCSSKTTSVLDNASGVAVGQYSSIAIGSDGFPVISYRDFTNTNLNFAKCSDVSCSSYATSSLDTGGSVGEYTSIAIGSDGFPVIAYYDNGKSDLLFLKCNDIYCQTAASSTANLTRTNSDLSRFLDDDGYTNVATADNLYDSLAAGTSTRLAYLFTKKNSNNTDDIPIAWEGQVSFATTTYLKIWNNSTLAWEVFDTESAPTANTDFILSATQTVSVANYYDASNVVYFRVETGTTTASTTLKTDYINISFPVPTLAQTSYIFLNDNGTTTDTYTQSHSAATSTSISSVKKGEKLIARIQIDNTGQATSTAQYRLQWENNTDAAGTWSDLGTTTQIRWAFSEKAAMPGRSGQVPLTSRQVSTCTTTTQFVPGFFVAGTATSSMLSLGPTKCTELAYAIETSGATLNKTYRLRLVTGSTTTQLDNYTQYPTFSIESAQTIRYSKEARGGYATTTLDSLGNVGGDNTSIAIGSDGFPVIAYYDATNFNLNFAKCGDTPCSSYATSSLDWGGQVGKYPSIAIGSDGFPVISYYDNDATRLDLNFVKCNNITCSSYATSTLDSGGDVGGGYQTSIAIGSDGFPVISYYDATLFNLNFAKCNNISCTSVATSSLDGAGAFDVGFFSSIAIGSDGFPVISYYDNTVGYLNLNLVKCNNISCSSYATSSLDVTGDVGYDTSIAIGSDGFPVITYYANGAKDLKFVKCDNISCSSKTISSLDTKDDVGRAPSIAIGADGFPVISYQETITQNLNFVKCNNTSCSSYATSSLDGVGATGYYTSLAIGSDSFPVVSYYDLGTTNLLFLKCNDAACSTAATSTRLSYLSNTNSDLSRFLDDDGYTNVGTSNDVYDSLAAGTSTRLAYNFTRKNATNTDIIVAKWEGQVSLATTTYLKIYNTSTGAWETLASNTSPTANTDFTLMATQTANIANYYDASNVVYVRVETGTTTASTTLKTDYISLGGFITERAYVFLNDNGTTTDTYTQSHSAATSTSISSVKKGEKLIARIQIDNTGSGTSTASYRLQWENNTDAAGTWTDLGTTTQIRWALSEKAAMPGRSGQVPLTTRQVGSCTGSTAFVSGFFITGTATSSMLALESNKCTELAYAIETSGATLGKTYRLRLVTGSTTTQLDNYTQYPTFSIEAAQTIRYSKEARGGYATTTLDSLGSVGRYSSTAIGADGFPVIAYYANTNFNLNFAKCHNTSCSSYATSSLDTGGNVGSYPSLAIGVDGFPVVSYYDISKANLNFVKCHNISCSSVATSSLDTAGDVGQFSSIAIGSDGFPVISYNDTTNGDLEFTKCNNISCTSVATSSLDWGSNVGEYTSIAIGIDGFPVISYSNYLENRLNFVKCNNISCSSYSTSSLDTAIGGSSGYSSVAIGSDGFPVIAYFDSNTGSDLGFIKCNNLSCSSKTSSFLELAGGGVTPSVAIGSDGFPVISYYANIASLQNLNFVKCSNVSCSSYATSSLDTGGDVGVDASLAIGSDGFPVISYYDTTNTNLLFLKCNDAACSTTATSTRLSYLSNTNSDLSRFLDDDGYTNVATANDVYDSLAAGTSTRLAYNFTKKHTNNTDVITPTWEGQVSKATTTYLKLFNHAAGTWETLDTDAAPTPNVDFVLTGTQSANLANYYDASNVVYLRVETGTTTASTTLKTDQMTITLGSTEATLSTQYYRWREDNGTEIAATYTTAENTALGTSSNMYLGDRKRLRFSVANTGAASASGYTYRLEHSSSSCTAWYAVPAYNTQSTQEWVMDQSQWVPDGAATTHSSGMTVPSGKSFVAGQVRLNLNQTAAHTLTTSEYTEIEFSFRSTAYATPNLPYCFRLTNAGSTTNFSYVVTPRIVVNPGNRPEYGGGGTESSGTGAARTGGGMGGGSGSEGSGSGPAQTGGGMGGGGGDSG